MKRDKHLVYNTAVLMGPNGQLIGKYRKVCLPHGEVERGIAPGTDYPVFETQFGKVGVDGVLRRLLSRSSPRAQ